MSRMQSIGIVALALALPACAPAVVVMDPGMPAAPPLAHSEIAGLVTVANDGAVELARLASERAEAAPVREYARHILADHQQAGSQFRMLIDDRNITPQRTQVVRDLEQRNRQALESLRAHEGRAFDRAFMDLDIATHEWLIRTFEQSLIPSARDRQLRMALQETHAGLSEHLNHARNVRNRL